MKLRLKANIRTTVEDGDKKLWKLLERHGYEVIGYWDDDLGIVRLNGKWGVINTEGKEVVPLKYDDVDYFSEGLAAVKLNGKWGFVDKEGKEVIPLKYDSVGSFHEGLAGVYLNGGKYGHINKQGKEYWDIVEIMKHNEQGYDEIFDELTEGGQWYFPSTFKGVTYPTHRFVKVGDQFLGTPEGLKAVKKSVTPEYFERRFITWQNSKTSLEILWENNKT